MSSLKEMKRIESLINACDQIEKIEKLLKKYNLSEKTRKLLEDRKDFLEKELGGKISKNG